MPRREREIYADGFCGDNSYSLTELAQLIPTLQKKYGKRAIIRFDAGYNNVSVVITPTKKIKSNENG